MNDYVLPAAVRRLIDEALESMDHVELLFRISQAAEVTTEGLARDAHLEPSRVAKVLRDLEQAQLITGEAGSHRVTRNPRNRAAIADFAATYNARPVTLIRAVYARPTALHSFADGTRLRRED